MKILSVNCGSSSLKFQAYEMPEEKVLISGYFEKIGLDDSFYTIKVNGEKFEKTVLVKDHAKAAELLIDELLENKIVSDLSEILGVGHRVVHGGDKYADSVIIDDDVIETVEDLSPLAPLHNPANLIGVRAMMSAIPNAKHVAVFDTAFHQTMPDVNFMYSLPYAWYKEYKIRKYGFHGTSHKYITNVMQDKLDKKDVNLIIAHIGSGGSLTCVKNGLSYDTTMGFGPNTGITMGTRCGDLDYSAILYIMKKTGKTIEEVDSILNKKSGLLGLSEKYSDHRDIADGVNNKDELCSLADEVYIDRIVKYISQYFVELNGNVDALVLTAGTGENARDVRENVLNKLNCLGIFLDDKRNNEIASFLDIKEGVITTDESAIPVYVIPTDEEVVIARDAYNFSK